MLPWRCTTRKGRRPKWLRLAKSQKKVEDCMCTGFQLKKWMHFNTYSFNVGLSGNNSRPCQCIKHDPSYMEEINYSTTPPLEAYVMVIPKRRKNPRKCWSFTRAYRPCSYILIGNTRHYPALGTTAPSTQIGGVLSMMGGKLHNIGHFPKCLTSMRASIAS